MGKELKKSKKELDELSDKFIKGMEISFERLLEKKIKEDGEFVFSENGKLVHIKARDFKK